MIKLKFVNKEKELMFFKDLKLLCSQFGYGVRYAELVNDLDVAEKEKEEKDDG